MRKLLALAFLAACGEPVVPGDAREFRDDFDSLASDWKVPSRGVRVSDGRLQLTTVLGEVPVAEYALASPFGPGWDFQVHVGSAGSPTGLPCSVVRIPTGHSRRHAWALELDWSRNYWGLQVGDGNGWELVGYSLGGAGLDSYATARLKVDGNDVDFWIDEEQVVDTVVADAAPNATGVALGVTRCNILSGVILYDWVELKELER